MSPIKTRIGALKLEQALTNKIQNIIGEIEDKTFDLENAEKIAPLGKDILAIKEKIFKLDQGLLNIERIKKIYRGIEEDIKTIAHTLQVSARYEILRKELEERL